ncbi:OmpA family protein, partial [Actinomadura kijaniata]|uniref:OmpA family protein n=1 Tax=Actinomadura kijaniata TaxID=46161 RepID=UPI003F1D4A0A
MTVLFPHSAPFQDVPLEDVPAGPVVFDRREEPVDPTRTRTAPPLVLPVIGSVETGPAAEDDGGGELSIRLASDVLFATGRADLNATARQTLAAVAQKIDASPGGTVRIDGHTDDTGDDAINGPLSRRRADAVRGALGGLVTRRGVTFRTRGHGSDEPVASNGTEAGRARNRRVTVTFARPAAA